MFNVSLLLWLFRHCGRQPLRWRHWYLPPLPWRNSSSWVWGRLSNSLWTNRTWLSGGLSLLRLDYNDWFVSFVSQLSLRELTVGGASCNVVRILREAHGWTWRRILQEALRWLQPQLTSQLQPCERPGLAPPRFLPHETGEIINVLCFQFSCFGAQWTLHITRV